MSEYPGASFPGRMGHVDGGRGHTTEDTLAHFCVKGGGIKAIGTKVHSCCENDNLEARWNDIPKATEEDFKGTRWLRMVRIPCHSKYSFETVILHLDREMQSESLSFALRVMFHQAHRINYSGTFAQVRRSIPKKDRSSFDECLTSTDRSVRKGREAYFIKAFQELHIYWLSKPRRETNYVGIYAVFDGLMREKSLEDNIVAADIFKKYYGVEPPFDCWGDCLLGSIRCRDYIPDHNVMVMLPFFAWKDLSDLTWVDLDDDFHEAYTLELETQKWNSFQCSHAPKFTLDLQIELFRRRQADSYKAAGNKYFKQGEYSKAEEEYTKALYEFPTYMTARNNRAMVYLKLGRYYDAVCDGKVILDVDPLNDKALMRVATGLNALGDVMGAEKLLRDFLQSPDVSDQEKVPVQKKLEEIVDTS